MRITILIAVASTLFTPFVVAAADLAIFEDHFENATLRVDFFRVGDARTETITIDRMYRQEPWAGPRRIVDKIPELGTHAVSMRDPQSSALLFSRGFDSYFSEYATTSAASEGTPRSFHESVLMPFPKTPVELVFESRRRDGTSREIARHTVDPEELSISLEPPRKGVQIVEAHIAGPYHSCLDVAILGEGYTTDERGLFEEDVKRFSATLLETEPYASRADKINIRGVLLPSAQSGCDEPTRSRYRDTSLDASFNALGSERYLLTEANRELRDIAANVPYDAVMIMINHERYGGGGIYNVFCTFTAHNQWSDYLAMHEFGHSFTGLADEYYSSAVAYNDFYPKGHEPVEPNVTALLDPEKLKWKELVTGGTAIPTPWEKTEYDAMDGAYQKERQALNQRIAEASRAGEDAVVVHELEQKAEDLSRSAAERAERLLDASAYVGQVGAFEGAGYASEGLYRPMLNCIMFSKGMRPFCAVCATAVAAKIDSYCE